MIKKFKQFREEMAVVNTQSVGGPVSDNNPPGPSHLMKKKMLKRKQLKRYEKP